MAEEITLPELLERCAKEMRVGDYTESSEALLITRDKETGIITFVPWGEEDTGLLQEAYRLKCVN
jgi:hypothetical protein